MSKKSFKTTGITTLLITVLLLEFFAIGIIVNPQISSKISNLTAVLPGVLIAKANKTRADDNLIELKENEILTQAASLKAQDMATRQYFSHVDPDGNQPWHYLDKAGYKYKIAGENLAVNFVDSTEVHKAWMNSPTHKANIVQPRFTEIGVATAEGIYKGKNAIFVVQFFGVPDESNSVFGFNVSSINNDQQNNSQVLGAFTENILTSPRTTILYTVMTIVGLVLIILVLKITIAKNYNLKDLFFNGLLLLIIIALAVFIYFLTSSTVGEIASVNEM